MGVIVSGVGGTVCVSVERNGSSAPATSGGGATTAPERVLERLEFTVMARRGVLISILAIAAAAVGAFGYLNATGFCYSQAKYLNDADLIREAIQYSLQKPPSDGADVIQYDSVETFISRNRDCCVILRQDRGEFENVLAERWVRLIGWYVLVVDVWYQFKEAGPNNFYEASIAMTSCGKFVDRHLSLGSRPRGSTGR
jgi:hypothetical protein